MNIETLESAGKVLSLEQLKHIDIEQYQQMREESERAFIQKVMQNQYNTIQGPIGKLPLKYKEQQAEGLKTVLELTTEDEQRPAWEWPSKAGW